MTGVGERRTLECLERLLEHGLVILNQAHGERRLINLRQRPSAKTNATPMPEVTTYRLKDSQKASFLSQFGPLGRIPGVSIRGAGQARFGGMKFDREVLKEADFLRVDQKKEILFLSQYRDHVDHFNISRHAHG